jgi:hypothetical protein
MDFCHGLSTHINIKSFYRAYNHFHHFLTWMLLAGAEIALLTQITTLCNYKIGFNISTFLQKSAQNEVKSPLYCP